ncbi:hypothetical protein ABZ892_33260, partial [Streptomyces sp. NPDC046924]|uniref:hypothetical protein n=1 Tax=Streptomyces sp. NPDC046924 TaxID=3155136 RepID=UPI0033DAB1E5
LELLTRWLPGNKGLAESDEATQAIGHAAAAVAADDPRLARAAGDALQKLPESAAAACASTLATTALLAHREASDPVGAALRDVLIDYLQRVPDEPEEPTQDAVDTCFSALTADFRTLSAAGSFARITLPMLMTTPIGRHQAEELAGSLINAIPPSDPAVAAELLPSLHILFHDDAARTGQLPPAVARLQQLVAHNQTALALTFAAHYVTHSLIDATWLIWYAQHWASLSLDTKDRVCAAVHRTDLPTDLRTCLVQHLLHTSADEPWQYAVPLWPSVTPDQQSSLLAAARGRVPGLADLLTDTDADLLCAALVKAEDHLGDVLRLMTHAAEENSAIAAFITSRLAAPNWTHGR